jgi:hypothetical protein
MRGWILIVAAGLGACGDAGSKVGVEEPWVGVPPLEGRAVTSAAGGFAMTFATSPWTIPLNAPFEVRFALWDADGVALDLDPAAVRVDADMPEHGHGMNVVPGVTRWAAERTAPDEVVYVARPLEFMMPGRWEIHVDVTRGAITERALVEVVVE